MSSIAIDPARQAPKKPSTMRTKLTEEQVTEIFSYRWENKDTSDSPLIGKCHVLAKRYKVSPKAIRDIWNMRTWTHVTHVGAGAPKEATLGAGAEGKLENESAARQDKGCSPISFSNDAKPLDGKKSSGSKDGLDGGMSNAQAIREMLLRRQMADTHDVPGNLEFGLGLHSTLHDVPTPPGSNSHSMHDLMAHEIALGKRARPDMMHMDMASQLNSRHGMHPNHDLEMQKRARANGDFSGSVHPLGLKNNMMSNMPYGLQRGDSSKNMDPVLESLSRMNFERQNSAQALSRMGTMTSLPVQPGSSGPLPSVPPMQPGSGPGNGVGLSLNSPHSVTASSIAMLQQLVNSTTSGALRGGPPSAPSSNNLLSHLQQLPSKASLSGGPSPAGLAGGPEAWRATVCGLR